MITQDIQDVTGQILKLNPDYDFTMSSDHEAHNVTGSTRRAGYVPTEHGIVPRAAVSLENTYSPRPSGDLILNRSHHLLALVRVFHPLQTLPQSMAW